MPFAQGMLGTLLSVGYAPRSWPNVLRTAGTNPFALLGLLVLVIGLVLLIRAKVWAKSIGAIAVVAGAILLVQVLHDIKVEIPSRVDTGQHPSVSN